MVNKQKILIVDDDDNIAELISLYLTKECFDTMIVEDGESALPRLWIPSRPNLILLDLMLPGIDGYQVCREVRSNSSIPDHHAVRQRAKFLTRCSDWSWARMIIWMKPFDSKELVARVKAVLRRYKPAMLPYRQKPAVKCVEYPDLSINQTNYSVIYDGENCRDAAKGTGAYSTFSQPLPTTSLRENSFWIRSGAMNTLATPAR